jgi:hypothetical protein
MSLETFSSKVTEDPTLQIRITQEKSEIKQRQFSLMLASAGSDLLTNGRVNVRSFAVKATCSPMYPLWRRKFGK